MIVNISLMIFYLIFTFFFILYFYFYIKTAITSIPYARTSRRRKEIILKMSKKLNIKKALDMGSGDGQLVIALNKSGILTDGVEINPFFVWYSRFRLSLYKINKAKIIMKDFWKADLSEYDLVVIYPIEKMLIPLEKKLKKGLKKGSYVIVNGFELPNWKEIKEEKRVFLYKV